MCKQEMAEKQVQNNALSLGDRVKLIVMRRRTPALELEESRTYTYTISCMYRLNWFWYKLYKQATSVKQPVGQVPRVTVLYRFHCICSNPSNEIMRRACYSMLKEWENTRPITCCDLKKHNSTYSTLILASMLCEKCCHNEHPPPTPICPKNLNVCSLQPTCSLNEMNRKVLILVLWNIRLYNPSPAMQP